MLKFGKKDSGLMERYGDRVSPVEEEKQLEALNVADDDPVLRSCLAILHGLELMAQEMVTTPDITAEERAVRAGQVGGLGEGQEAILARVEEAREAAAKNAEKGRRRPKAMG